tara:strand:- start:7740 stop:9443 length:1704 start_codon:yes stop_codon:yes gene_type:complete
MSDPRIQLTKLNFESGLSVDLANSRVVVIVGPNNSGKSQSLRDIPAFAIQGTAGVSIRSCELERIGSEDDLRHWIEENWTRVGGSDSNPQLTHGLSTLHTSETLNCWREDQALGPIARYFIASLSTMDRLRAANPVEAIDVVKGSLSKPIHALYLSGELEEKVSEIFRVAFGEDLVLHRGGGKTWPLHVGTRPDGERFSVDYLRGVSDLPSLEDQGDGMRAFAGVLLSVVVGTPSAILIDEPEAFLHPPQATLLAASIAEHAPDTCQVILATHSQDILKGLLDKHAADTTIIRLSVDNGVRGAMKLASDDVAALWGDTLLKYSNVLSGLFYETVVVCESESDCKFYAAVLDAMEGEQSSRVLFLPAGGKNKIPKVVAALSTVGVDTRVVADFDVLNMKETVQEILEALGSSNDGLVDAADSVDKAIRQKRPQLNASEFKDQVIKVVEAIEDKVSDDHLKHLRELSKKTSPWKEAKEVGVAAVPRGDQSRNCEKLLEDLSDAGLHVVPVGELESFCRTIPGHGAAWATEAVRMDLANSAALEPLRSFVKRVVEPRAPKIESETEGIPA